MKTVIIRKVENRLATLNGRLHDIFCNGGESSVRFHDATIGTDVEVVITSTRDDRFFSPYTLIYIQ